MERFFYTIHQKLQILELVRTGQLIRLNVQFPNVTQKQIDDWVAKEDQMRNLTLSKRLQSYTLHSGPALKYPELYQFLYQTFKELRVDRRAVTIYSLMSIAEEEEPALRSLTKKGKESLIRRFMEHFKLSIREITGTSGANPDQLTEEQIEQIESFQREYKRIIVDNNISKYRVFNMDQTSVYYENPSLRTIDYTGNKEIPVQTQGGEKKRVTLFSLMESSGGPYTQLCVFKGVRDARIHQEVEAYDEVNIFHTVQANAWCDAEVFFEWMQRIWYGIAQVTAEPKLLILDSYPTHKKFQLELRRFNTHVLFVPEGLTWRLQPCDLGFHKLMKDELRKIWLRDQRVERNTEKAQREYVSSTLKEVFDIMSDNDNSIFWQKAGLMYPEEDIIARARARERENRNEMEEEFSNAGEVAEDSQMIIEGDVDNSQS